MNEEIDYENLSYIEVFCSDCYFIIDKDNFDLLKRVVMDDWKEKYISFKRIGGDQLYLIADVIIGFGISTPRTRRIAKEFREAINTDKKDNPWD